MHGLSNILDGGKIKVKCPLFEWADGHAQYRNQG